MRLGSWRLVLVLVPVLVLVLVLVLVASIGSFRVQSQNMTMALPTEKPASQVASMYVTLTSNTSTRPEFSVLR